MHETIAVPLYDSPQAAAPAANAPETATDAEPMVSPDVPPIWPGSAAAPFMSLKDAVQNCRRAYNQTLAADEARGLSHGTAVDNAAKAYCKALPYLTSACNIRAFIACVAHAMPFRIIHMDDGLKLINAARTAFAALPRESRPAGRPRSNFTNP
jgi:hypothetical protein